VGREVGRQVGSVEAGQGAEQGTGQRRRATWEGQKGRWKRRQCDDDDEEEGRKGGREGRGGKNGGTFVMLLTCLGKRKEITLKGWWLGYYIGRNRHWYLSVNFGWTSCFAFTPDCWNTPEEEKEGNEMKRMEEKMEWQIQI
jgi:hypothetical protein